MQGLAKETGRKLTTEKESSWAAASGVSLTKQAPSRRLLWLRFFWARDQAHGIRKAAVPRVFKAPTIQSFVKVSMSS